MLLPHNQDVFNDIKTAYRDNSDILVIHGTGMGKSFLFLELCDSLFKDKKILFVVPKIATKSGGIESYDEYKGSSADVTFKTYNWFRDEERAKEAADVYDVIVYDEAHHLGSDLYGLNALRTFDMMRGIPGKYILGLTATNLRADKVDVSAYFSKTVIGCSIFQAIKQGIIPQFEYLVCRDEIEEMKRKGLETPSCIKKLDYSNSLPLLKDIVDNNPKKRWLVFFPSISAIEEHKQTVMDAFSDEYRFLTITAYNDTKVSEIEEYDKTVVLCVDKLLEGVHVPDTTGIILFRNIRSLPVFQQVLGRVVHVGSKENPLIIDCTQVATRMLAKLLKEDRKRGAGASAGKYNPKPILFCSLQNTEYFNIAKLLALAEDMPWDEKEEQIIRDNYGKVEKNKWKELLPDRSYTAIRSKAGKLGLTESREHEWSDEELKLLSDNAGKLNIKELMKLLPSKTDIAIKSKIKTLGLNKVYAHAYWTKQEDDIIRKHADKMTWTKMEELLPGRNAQTIRVRANKLGLIHTKGWSKEQDEWLKSVYDTMDINDIAAQVGKNKDAVLVHARSMGLYKGAKRNLWDDAKITFLVQNYAMMDRNEIAKKIGMEPRQITKKASLLGLSKQK